MTDTELDRWAAEVMGSKTFIDSDGSVWWEAGIVRLSPTTCADDDIAVRDKWLETATAEQQRQAADLLRGKWRSRLTAVKYFWEINYRPGDFTRAIHAAMTKDDCQ